MKSKISFNLLITFLTLSIFTISCKKNNLKAFEFKIKNDINKDEKFKIKTGDVELMSLKSEKIFGLFTEIAVVDSLLICGNLRSPKLVNVYSLNSGNLLNELIGRGESESEGLSVSSIYTNKNFIWIYDITLSRFFKINPSIKKGDSLATSKIGLSKILKNSFSPSVINDSLFFATTYSMDNYRYLYASPKKILKQVGKLPEVENTEYLTDIPKTKFPNKAYIFKAKSIKHPSENKIAILYNKADRIELYSNDKLIKIVQNKDSFNTIMQVTKNAEGGYSVEDSEKTKYAYLSTSSTEKYIYALYSGSNDTSSNRVLVFDWNGQFIKELSLDRKVCKIFVNPKNNILYCYEIEANGIYSTQLKF